MNTNDPGREPGPTDAAVLMELARQYDENIAPNWPNRIWDRVEIAADRGREYLSGARPMPDAPDESVKFWKDGWHNLDQDNRALTARIADLEAELDKVRGVFHGAMVLPFRSNPRVNMDDDMVRVTTDMTKRTWFCIRPVSAGKEPTDAE